VARASEGDSRGLLPLAGILLAYLVFLFTVAAAAERVGSWFRRPRLRTATYVLSMSVYCTARTFYGSVGFAVNRGLEFITIYLGPALVALMWPTVPRKLVRVAKECKGRVSGPFGAARPGCRCPRRPSSRRSRR
jgi:Na+/proline symporter